MSIAMIIGIIAGFLIALAAACSIFHARGSESMIVDVFIGFLIGGGIAFGLAVLLLVLALAAWMASGSH